MNHGEISVRFGKNKNKRCPVHQQQVPVHIELTNHQRDVVMSHPPTRGSVFQQEVIIPIPTH